MEKILLMRTAGAYCAPDVQNAVLERLAGNFMSSYGAAEMGWIAWGYAGDIRKVDRCVGHVVDSVEAAALIPMVMANTASAEVEKPRPVVPLTRAAKR